MRSSLRALFGDRVRIAAAARVPSGSPALYLLRAEPNFAKTVSAAQVLAKRHLPLRVAKAVVGRLLDEHDVTIEIPKLEDAGLFEHELEELSVTAVRHEAVRELINEHDLAQSR